MSTEKDGRADALAEIRKHLHPTNENVKQGFLVAAIRDLAQIALSSLHNSREGERRVQDLEAYVRRLGLCPEHLNFPPGPCAECATSQTSDRSESRGA